MLVGAMEPKALWPGSVGILHEHSSSTGKDAWQASACLTERKSVKAFVHTADV